jgi:hypothetical protein
MKCPLLKDDCLEEQCAWWEAGFDCCAINCIAGMLDDFSIVLKRDK